MGKLEHRRRKKIETVVITRHEALVEVLIRDHGIDPDRVITHATSEDVEGKIVIGVLPMHLAALAAKIGVLTLDLPAEMRGKELTIEEVRQYAAPEIEWFVVRTEADQQQLLDDAAISGGQGSLAGWATDRATRWLAR